MYSEDKEKEKQKLLAFMTTLIAAMEEHDISLVVKNPVTSITTRASISVHTASADRREGDSLLIVSGAEVAMLNLGMAPMTVIDVTDVRDAFCKKLMVKDESSASQGQTSSSTYKTTARYSFSSIQSLYQRHDIT